MFSTQPTIFSRISLCHIFQEASFSFSRSPLFLCLSTLFIVNGSFDISRMILPFLHHRLQESHCLLDISRMWLLFSPPSQSSLMDLLPSALWFSCCSFSPPSCLDTDSFIHIASEYRAEHRCADANL